VNKEEAEYQIERLPLAEMGTANARTLEEAEALVLELARHHRAYGAMIYKIREAWAEELERKYGIKDGAWDVRRDLALSQAEHERDLLAAALWDFSDAIPCEEWDRHSAARSIVAKIYSEEPPR